MKYFLLSIFSSALLLFGFSYLYGMAGTTNLTALGEAVMRPAQDAAAAGLALDGGGDGDGRPRLPHHGRAVPLLRPGRVPGHDAVGRRPPGVRAEGGRLRRAAAHVRLQFRTAGRLAPDSSAGSWTARG